MAGNLNSGFSDEKINSKLESEYLWIYKQFLCLLEFKSNWLKGKRLENIKIRRTAVNQKILRF